MLEDVGRAQVEELTAAVGKISGKKVALLIHRPNVALFVRLIKGNSRHRAAGARRTPVGDGLKVREHIAHRVAGYQVVILNAKDVLHRVAQAFVAQLGVGLEKVNALGVVDDLLGLVGGELVVLLASVERLPRHRQVHDGQLRFGRGGRHPAALVHPGQSGRFGHLQIGYDLLVNLGDRGAGREEVLGGGGLGSEHQGHVAPQAHGVEVGPGPQEAGFAQNPGFLLLIHGRDAGHLLQHQVGLGDHPVHAAPPVPDVPGVAVPGERIQVIQIRVLGGFGGRRSGGRFQQLPVRGENPGPVAVEAGVGIHRRNGRFGVVGDGIEVLRGEVRRVVFVQKITTGGGR